MIAKLKEISVKFDADGEPKVTITVDKSDESSLKEFLNMLQKGKEYIVQIEPKPKGKRSISANALLWSIIGKMAKEMWPLTKEEIYRHMLRQVGVYECFTIREDAYPYLIKDWEKRGTGWFTEVLSPARDGMIDVACYYGTSCYDTKDMSRCIDFLLEEAKQMESDCLPLPLHEIEKIKKEWGTGIEKASA